MMLYLNVALAIYLPARGRGMVVLNCASLLIFAFLKTFVKKIAAVTKPPCPMT